MLAPMFARLYPRAKPNARRALPLDIKSAIMSNIRAWAVAHPKLAAWALLGLGMVIILIIAARDVGLVWNQWLFLVLATLGVAGLCVWIIGWESDSDDEPKEQP